MHDGVRQAVLVLISHRFQAPAYKTMDMSCGFLILQTGKIGFTLSDRSSGLLAGAFIVECFPVGIKANRCRLVFGHACIIAVCSLL